jgi:4-amino-4-deoxy-L-arabinose transferase-like glycosyltransferase
MSADRQKARAGAGVPGPWAFALAAAVAVGAYVYGLDSINAPTIGDEPLYIQITRVTAASGRWLPLLSESGITDTKPPFLFWQGILSTGRGVAWDLWHLRLPVVATSLLTAVLAGLLAARIGGRAAGLRAGLVFLGFLSTIQHGRPFLTNAGETLFLFLPLLLVHGRERTGPLLALACGLSFGAAVLFKAFFLVVPGAFSLALVLLRRDGWALRPFLQRRLGFLALASIVGLAAFALWPLLDPRPDLIWSQFVLAESARKLKFATFVSGLFSGEDALWEIWIGDLKNAGIYLLLLLALLRDLWRRRRALGADEQELWLYVLAFLLVYSLPTQRQANYLLPSMAALAVLLALRWDDLSPLAFRATLVVLAVAGLGLPAFEWLIARRLGASPFGVAAVVLPVALGLLAAAGVRWPRFGRRALPYLALVALAAGSAVVTPFARPFPASAVAEVAGRPVLVPDRFAQTQERYRFLLPGADVRGYPCPGGPVRCQAPDPGAGMHAALYLDAGEPLPPGWEAVAERPHFKGRHTTAQILEIMGGRTELLVERLVLARPGP